MKIYVAGSSREAQKIAQYMRWLREFGHEVTLDWTVDVLAATKPDRELADETRWQFAHKDIEAIAGAQCLWLCVPETSSLGAWIEFGAAIGMRRSSTRILFVSGYARRSIFTSLADVTREHHEQMLEVFRELAGARPR